MGALRERLVLRARDGRAVLVRVGGGDPAGAGAVVDLPQELADLLHEWAAVVATLGRRGGSGDERAAVAERGRVLAARVADATGLPVEYVGEGHAAGGPGRRRADRRRPEPVPWATGSAVTVATAVPVALALVVLSRELAAVAPWLAPLANAVVAAGLAPSVWLARNVPVWRWVALGVPVGIGAAWVVLLASLLG